jgi:hypothetical protein
MEEYAASHSAHHTHFHDMPKFIRVFIRLEDDMPKNLPHIPKIGVLCRMVFGIINRWAADPLGAHRNDLAIILLW